MAGGGGRQHQQQQGLIHSHTRSLICNYLLFAGLGILCSFFYNSYFGTFKDLDQQLLVLSQTQDFSLEEVRSVLQGTDCEEVVAEAQMPEGLKDVMGTKLRYQFESVINDESTVGECQALRVEFIVVVVFMFVVASCCLL